MYAKIRAINEMIYLLSCPLRAHHVVHVIVTSRSFFASDNIMPRIAGESACKDMSVKKQCSPELERAVANASH